MKLELTIHDETRIQNRIHIKQLQTRLNSMKHKDLSSYIERYNRTGDYTVETFGSDVYLNYQGRKVATFWINLF